MGTPIPAGAPKIPLRCPKCQKSFAVPLGLSSAVCPTCKEPLTDLITGYRITRKLGAGGMGDVFLADQTSLSRPVALKILPLALTKDPSYVKRFLVEARAAGRVRHENIVAGVDAGEDGGRPYFVMEYVEGETLLDVVKREGPLPEKRVREIARQVAEGLKAAYEEGLIHRDIKPANIMITKDGTAKVCDFGLARDLRSDIKLTQEGHVHTSPGYASPEQGKGVKELDHRTDMYSLGVTIFEAVTKKLPFEGETAGALLVKHVTQQPPAPKSLNPNVSSGMNQLILRLLRKQPTGRFETYDELLEAIEGLGQEKSERVGKRGGTARLPKVRKTPPLPLILGGAGVGVLLIIVLVVLLSGGSSSTNAPPPSGPPSAPSSAPSAAKRDLDTIRSFGNDLAGKPSLVSERRRQVVALELKYRGTPHEAAFAQALQSFQSRLEEAATTVAQSFLAEAARQLEAKKNAAALKELEKFPQGFGGTAAFQHVSGKAKEFRTKLEGLYNTEVEGIDREISQGKLADARTRMGILMGRVTYIGETGQTYLKPEYKTRLAGLSKRISEEELLARKAQTQKPPTAPRPAPSPNPKPPPPANPAPPPRPKPAPAPKPAARPVPPAAGEAPVARSTRLPVPESADLKKAQRTLREIFADDYSGNSAAGKILLAKKLISEARKPEQEPTARYALLKEAVDLGTSVGEARIFLPALEKIVRLYDVDGLKMIGEALLAAERKATEAYQRRAIAEEHLTLAEKAVDQDQFNVARRSLSKASSLARRARAKELSDRVSQLSKDVSAMQRAFVSVQRSLEILKRNSDDPKANLAVGRYECFLRGRWEKGLPYLAKSGSTGLASAAKKDLERPTDAKERLAVGDAWWNAASRESEPAKTGVRGRAAGWYQLALPEATGIEAIRLKRRITDVPEGKVSVPGATPAGPGRAAGMSTLRTGLVGYWPFEEGRGLAAADHSGKGSRGRLESGATWTTGKIGSALLLDGGDDRVVVSDPANANGLTGDMTVAVWLRTTTTSTDGADTVTNWYRGLWILEKDKPNTMTGWALTNHRGKAKFLVIKHEEALASTTRIDDGRWHHVAGVRDAKGNRWLYVDGKLEASGTGGSTLSPSNDSPLTFGCDSEGRSYFKGALDEVRIYSRALEAHEIRALGDQIAPDLIPDPPGAAAAGNTPAPQGSSSPWRPLFDGRSLAGWNHNDGWRVSGGAIVRNPGQPSALQSREQFGDVDIRVRFECKDSTKGVFRVRQGPEGMYEIILNRSDLRPLEGGTREILLKCRGETVTAKVEGAPVSVRANGTPRRGKIQLNVHPDEKNFRFLSIDVRAPGP